MKIIFNRFKNQNWVHKITSLDPGEFFDYKCLIEYVNDRPGHDFRYAIDSSKIFNNLGWKPTESFHSGIKKTISWYLNNIEFFK